MFEHAVVEDFAFFLEVGVKHVQQCFCGGIYCCYVAGERPTAQPIETAQERKNWEAGE